MSGGAARAAARPKPATTSDRLLMAMTVVKAAATKTPARATVGSMSSYSDVAANSDRLMTARPTAVST